MSAAPDPKRRRMARTATLAAVAVLGMSGLAFAAVPLYRAFCSATGYGGTTQVARGAPTRILDRRVEIRFDTNVSAALPIEFTPDQPSQTLRLGETGLAFFRVHNTSDHSVIAVASYNVTPHKIGVYFTKLECFCFQPHELRAGETAEYPVVYFVDPQLASDPLTKEVRQVTLSYTMFRSVNEAAAALQAGN